MFHALTVCMRKTRPRERLAGKALGMNKARYEQHGTV